MKKYLPFIALVAVPTLMLFAMINSSKAHHADVNAFPEPGGTWTVRILLIGEYSMDGDIGSAGTVIHSEWVTGIKSIQERDATLARMRLRGDSLCVNKTYDAIEKAYFHN